MWGARKQRPTWRPLEVLAIALSLCRRDETKV